ncbi:MAG TPA: prenyltransferase/squalene oxidase repeat-containing protein [Solirubrobacteraceae bacterium]|nr:prenyltransferase/squalene oxidase repeat-containing protein [Solirubrobacteraceae bacterium]
MTWQVGAFGILALALAGGFAWYERTRPDARIVALVGTLAAFAALGRIAFAALPNVKPTTDIVLVSGYALGSGPGFAVGALAGLTSNFFFGQGPWTPWQMAGWGATGVIGAGLARATGRRISRWPLALICTVVGFAFTALQDFGDWITYSNHSLGELGVYVGKGIGFDCIHAAGCLLFALALGPALIRSLSRFAMRLHVTWRPQDAPRVGTAASRAGVAVLVVVMTGAWLAGQPGGGVGRAIAATGPIARTATAGTPAGYLLSAQNSDGGFGPAPGQSSLQLYAGWAALGLAATGENPQDIRHDGRSVIDYIESGLAANTDPGSVERTILVVRAAGLSAESFGGRNLVSALEHDIGRNGAVSDQTNWTAFAILALRAADIAPTPATVSWMVRQEDSDGGFNYGTRGGSSDVDDTGSVLEALAGVGGSAASRARARAVRYIRSQQDSDGGFPSQPGTGSNAQSTAFAIQGLIAAGVNPGSLHRRGAPSPLGYLNSLIASDGHVQYARGTEETPTWVTGEALMALEGKSLPLAPVPLPAQAPPPSAHPTTARRPAPRRAPAAANVRHRTPHGRRAAVRLAGRANAATSGVDRLVAYAGILTAIALAPLGQG